MGKDIIKKNRSLVAHETIECARKTKSFFQRFVSCETVRTFWNNHTLNEKLLILFLLFVIFPIRYVVPHETNSITGAYSDFTAVSIYSFDFVLLLIVAQNLKSFMWNNFRLFAVWSAFTILTVSQSFISAEPILGVFFAVKLSLYLLFVLSIFGISKKYIQSTLPKLFVALGSLQAIIAIWQFLVQHSIGLNLIGESVLSTTMYNVAKVVAHGTTFLRAYGTFPHSNILAVFLFFAFLFNLYLLLKNSTKFPFIYKISLIFITWGIFLTFSRSVWLVSTTCAVFILTRGIFKNLAKASIHHVTFVLFVNFVIASLVLSPLIISRAENIEEQVSRQQYSNIGIQQIVYAFPLGVGPGQSILFMQEFTPITLEQWEIQPIHNYYLILLAEFGIPGLFVVFLLFLTLLWAVKLAKIEQNSYIFAILLFGVAFLMLFDHYFYTTEQSKAILWLLVALVIALGKFHKKDLIYGNFFLK